MYQIAVILTDAKRRILWVNEDFTSITGYSHEEAIGRIPGDLLQGPLTEKEAIDHIRDGLRRPSSVKADLINYRKNGEPYSCSLVIHPIFTKEKEELTNFIAYEVDGDKIQDTTNIPILQADNKYSSSSLKGIDELKLYSRIRAILENERLYLDANLSLRTLADRLDTNTKYLSQVVNHCSGHNFQQFVNTYRIQSVKARLAEGAHNALTLFGVAQQCGFKNKSTFYKVFKDVTNLTPREYLEQTQEKV